MNKKERLKYLQDNEKLLTVQLSENRTEQREIRKQIWIKETGLDIGSEVNLIGDRKGVIIKIEVRYSTVRPIVNLYKKDGKLGKRETRVWSIKEIIF